MLVVTNNRPNLCTIGMGKGNRPLAFGPGETKVENPEAIAVLKNSKTVAAYKEAGWLSVKEVDQGTEEPKG